MKTLLAGAILLQLADLASMDAATEANPLGLHPMGPVLKLLLIVGLAAGTWAVGRRWAIVLIVASIAGLVGYLSNVL